MSSQIIATLRFAGEQVNIFLGIPVLVAGLLGGFLNLIVFLTLRTFRESSSAFYLIVMSIVNSGRLLTGLMSYILINGYAIDWTTTSLAYCKIRYFLVLTFAPISCTCLCLSTIDQYFATCSRPRWQHWSNIKLANLTTGKISCTSTNVIFSQYRTYGINLILIGFLPVSITISFGLFAFRNVKQLAHRALPLVRRELDKQITAMVLLQVVFNAFMTLPYLITSALALDTNIMSDPVVAAKIQFLTTVTILIYYANCSIPFYLYMCVSERFRRQFIYALFKIHLNRWQQPRMPKNQVVPGS
ncbi:hypothetical protein I4U23_022267 [Adineta vaga]|nr:hypothetical protein I4U23_022267 [Adineta vaga]